MKKILLLIYLLVLSTTGYSQIHTPVKWSTSVEKVADLEYDLVMNATIDAGWHLYSQNVKDDGPIATSFSINATDKFELVEDVIEEEGHTVDDPIFNMKIKFFEKKAIFKQRIKVLSGNALKINGKVEFMVCDDSSCLPPNEIDLAFLIPTNKTNAIIVNPNDEKEIPPSTNGDASVSLINVDKIKVALGNFIAFWKWFGYRFRLSS